MKAAALNLLAIAAAVDAYTPSVAGTKAGCYWNVPGVGPFNTNINISPSNFATQQDIISSTYTVAAGNSPFARRFDFANIGFGLDGALTLTVPGGQQTGPISTAQLVTEYSDILYGSVRTVAKISNVPGTTHGFSFYANDYQEVDFAFLTSDISVVHLTNQQTSDSAAGSSFTTAAPADAATAWHEYRLDWLPGLTSFYIDGVKVKDISANVPTTPGFWLWNNWSNGNSWAQGPPTLPSVLQILSIDAYLNRTAVANSILANPAQCPVAPSALPASSSTTSSTAKASTTSSSTSITSSVTKASSATTSATKASTTSAAASSAPFYIQAFSTFGTIDSKYLSVASGNGGEVTGVPLRSSATQFYIDGSGRLIESNPSSGLAANLDTNTQSQRLDFDPITSTTNYGFANCNIAPLSNAITCTVKNIMYTPATCNNDGYIYFATFVPLTCTAISLVAVYA